MSRRKTVARVFVAAFERRERLCAFGAGRGLSRDACLFLDAMEGDEFLRNNPELFAKLTALLQENFPAVVDFWVRLREENVAREKNPIRAVLSVPVWTFPLGGQLFTALLSDEQLCWLIKSKYGTTVETTAISKARQRLARAERIYWEQRGRPCPVWFPRHTVDVDKCNFENAIPFPSMFDLPGIINSSLKRTEQHPFVRLEELNGNGLIRRNGADAKAGHPTANRSRPPNGQVPRAARRAARRRA